MSQDAIASPSSRIRVLVADDDPTARELITSRIQRLGCEIAQAEDGIIAWHAIMSNSFDLAIVDLSMPNLDGFELLRCVRNHPRTKHMPLVVVTSQNDKDSVEEALSSGATSFLTKPINWTTFTSHIEYLLKLSHTVNDARKKMRCAEATTTVKDAVLGNMLSQTSGCASSILSAVQEFVADFEQAGIRANDDQTPESLRGLIRIGQRLQGVVDNTNRMLELIPQTVAADDELVMTGTVLQHVHEAAATTAAAREVELVFLPSSENPMIRCGKTSMIEAITQLVVNAVGNSRPGQAVKVSCQVSPDAEVLFEVSDDGEGMSYDAISAALSPLAVTDAVRGDGQSNLSLALPLSKAIAEAHGGTFDVSAATGSGTRVSLKLPPERVIFSEEDAA